MFQVPVDLTSIVTDLRPKCLLNLYVKVKVLLSLPPNLLIAPKRISNRTRT